MMSLEEMTIGHMWKSTIKGMWSEAIGIPPWFRDDVRRCDFCGRRLDRDAIARPSRSPSGKSVTFTETCLNHGRYEGQVVMDCFTAVEMTLHNEPRFYHETAILHEAAFYAKATFKFVRQFFRQLPLEILCSIDLPIRKAIKRQEERLGYK
jgi:hypothetical protein